MRSFRDEVLGIPEVVQTGVDADLLAATRGPAALDRALEPLHPAEVESRYRAALARLASTPTTRAHGRRAWEDFDTAEAAVEQQHIRRGGNR